MFYLARHAKTDANAGDIISPDDVGLSEEGANQANDLAQFLKSSGYRIERIVASDLWRAKQTAKTIGDILGVPVESEPDLAEYNFGNLKGKPTDALLSTATLNKFLQDPTSFGAERFEDAFARISAFCSKVDYNTNTLAISHSGIMRFALYYFEKGPVLDLHEFLNSWYNMRIGNTSVFSAASHDSKMELIYQIKRVGNQK